MSGLVTPMGLTRVVMKRSAAWDHGRRALLVLLVAFLSELVVFSVVALIIETFVVL
jgi:hypothetical protein